MSYEQGELHVTVPGPRTEWDLDDPNYEPRPYDIEENEFGAYLPHSCDKWIISAGTRDETIAGLELLVSDAQAAIVKLRKSQAR